MSEHKTGRFYVKLDMKQKMKKIYNNKGTKENEKNKYMYIYICIKMGLGHLLQIVSLSEKRKYENM